MVPEGWMRVRFGDFLSEIQARAGDRPEVPILSVTKNYGIMLSSKRFRNRIVAKDTTKYRLAAFGKLVVDPMLLWTGTIGLQSVVEVGKVSPDYRVYDISDEFDTEFVGALVRSKSMLPYYQTGARGTNVRRNRIARSDFLAIPVNLPPLGEQRKIAAILGSVDALIERTQAVIDQLEVVKKGLMQELLTRGLPGRHTRFKQTEIGEIPESWEVVRLDSICSPKQWRTISKDKQSQSGYPLYGANGIIGYVSEFNHTSPTVTVTCRGATCGAITVTSGKCYVNGNAMCLDDLDEDLCITGFLASYLSYSGFQETISGSAQPQITRAQLSPKLLPLPCLEEQERIAQRIGGIRNRMMQESETRGALTSLKSALSTALLSGQLRVTPDEGPTS